LLGQVEVGRKGLGNMTFVVPFQVKCVWLVLQLIVIVVEDAGKFSFNWVDKFRGGRL
jgi:hypothetical protein